MGLDRLMHDRNRYKKKPPDFLALAKKSPELRRLCTLNTAGRINVNFNDDEVVRTLTEVLLREDFAIDVQMPKGYLVPRVPQRLNYVLIVEDLIRLNEFDDAEVVGLDIGTGPVCIYPLLAVQQNPKWKMYASELNPHALEFAKENVQRSSKNDHVKVCQASEDNFFKQFLSFEPKLTFTMCNPPFFDQEELDSKFNQVSASSSTYTNEDETARSRTIAQHGELSSKGGEVKFVKRMIDESIKSRDRISIYTTLLGKKSSLSALKQHLRANGIEKYQDWTIGQGRTCRWILAWTFDEKIRLK